MGVKLEGCLRVGCCGQCLEQLCSKPAGLAWLIIPQDWALRLPWPDVTLRSWRVFVVISALPSVVSAVMLLLLPESPKFLFSQAKEDQALDVLRRVFSVNTGRPAAEYPVRFVQTVLRRL